MEVTSDLSGYMKGGYDPERFLLLRRARDDPDDQRKYQPVAGYVLIENGCHYFALNLDRDPHARRAAAAYAASVRLENEQLASDLNNLLEGTRAAFYESHPGYHGI